MATEAERLYITLEARLDKYTRDLNQAQATTNAKLGAIEKRYAAFAAQLKTTTSSAALSMGGMFAGLGGAVVSQQLIEYANAWTRVQRAVEGGEQTFGLALKSGSELTDLANEARVDVEAFAKTYVRAEAAIRDYGFAAGTGAEVTSTLSKALKLGGAAATEQASTILQFSQALQKGKLDGDEFRTVMENAGVVQELLAERLKVSKGEIIKMAAEGKLQVRDLVGAMIDGKDKIDRIFSGLPATVDEAFTVLRNNVVRYIGEVDQATGASQGLVNMISEIGRNIDTVANGAFVLGAALLATFGGGAMTALIGLASRLASLPALFAAGAAGAVSFGSDATLNVSRLAQALEQGADMATALQVAMREGGAGATTVSDQFRGLANVIASDLLGSISTISQALTGQIVDWDKLRTAAIMAVGAIVGGAKSIKDLVGASLTAIPLAGEVAFKELANKIIRILNFISTAWTDGVNGILEKMNQLPGFEYKLETPDLIGEFDTSEAYRRGAELSKSLTAGIAENFDLKGFADRVQGEADKIATDRLAKSWAPVTPVELKRGVLPGAGDDADAAKARRRFERDMIEAEARLEMMQLEQASIGRSAFETERLRTQSELLNQARAAGVRLTDADRVQIDAISTAMAGAIVQTENMRAAYQLMADETKSFFSDFAKGLKDGESATELLANGLNRIADKLIDMAVNDLVDQALGGLLGRGGPQSGSSGGLVSGIGAIFGFKDGGVMVPGKGPARLPRFARGGVSNSAAIFGEAGPEAAVPLPDGRSIPVNLRLPEIPKASAPSAVSNNMNMQLTIDARGATSDGVAALKADLVPTIQKVVRNELNQAFDRSSRFSRTGI